MKPNQSADFIYGTRAVIESIEAGKEVDKILLQKDLKNELILELMSLAKAHSVPVQKVPVEKLNRLTKKNHQGVVAYLSSVVYASLDNVISEAYSKGETPLLIILDRVTDVRNIGAIARTAECAGAHAIVVPSRGTAQLGADAMKTSAGALNHIAVCRVENLKTTIKEIQANGISVIACSEKADKLVYEADLTAPTAIMMGSEEDGISPEYMKLADGHVKLPINGQIESLNVSVASGVIIYEVLRQRG
ncbi:MULTISPECIES: 23S rRNA (guanosine(2251)-2'-O)-methyltransferase RlmB [Roseivirga]|uniref:RNA methyltransferase n=1 Tax=Roseivirga spongicola TaxID=333140 RepID=A0A150XI10_9BACT|nr:MULTISPECIES: 23S rRNA (guanosine(2251)-2'-O)-methyltransferase RlmB [Roseivirga]KYG78359.1 RNA methyltransferase [Roseivirga spongicola]MBO6496714.1 23S rRNA (guanosine(2251)-2'-O)-methyltransferase RlmB [Roseivirga sp.]MBO6660814.1 23S rRNA (guanosine(2251)-2'-O)-methyltransferase RlmB [Roseivirga sp.]MBO6909202.1 23S rRNA (guanosine(2251)-2'-O)-methyltransferase RlmB [Roseivirga sp.]WPZ12106.1 23S rRNA (guanosine(2251)-2'-O)-methyltransferase RlmB [Roseivirga spongicola]